jgi:exopolysaccharide biosynthesis polyprenyl glycosylphosphotransferase
MTIGLRKLKILILIAVDLAAAYAALAATIYLRYPAGEFAWEWSRHVVPFSIVFVLWLASFFVVGLYDMDRAPSRLDLLSKAGESFAASFLLSLAVFYFFTDFRVTPKTNLIIAMSIFAALFVGWRLIAAHLFSLSRFRARLAFIGRPPEADDLCDLLKRDPGLGFNCLGVFDPAKPDEVPAADIIVVSHQLGTGNDLSRSLYARFFAATTIVDFPTFHEQIRRSVPASALTEQWVLTHLAVRDLSFYDHLKRPLDAALGVLLFVPAAILMPFIAVLVWLGDRGPVFFTQERVGRGGKGFRIIKFRTMRVDAEKTGAAFAEENDPRVTGIGRILRRTRLDEIPQLWNIIRGEMSFVGPRPERPEFEVELSRTIPLFPVRHLVRPGLSGWAQVNDSYAATKDDHARKLRYDLYYLKHRSFTLDAAIILRTIYSVLKRKGR